MGAVASRTHLYSVAPLIWAWAGDQQPGAAAERKIFPLYVGEAVLAIAICRALEIGIGRRRQVENGDADFTVDVFEA